MWVLHVHVLLMTGVSSSVAKLLFQIKLRAFYREYLTLDLDWRTSVWYVYIQSININQ